jgi:hypothetical protein
MMNGELLKAPSTEAIYPKGVLDLAEAKLSDDSVAIEVGKPVDGRTKRSVRLVGD